MYALSDRNGSSGATHSSVLILREYIEGSNLLGNMKRKVLKLNNFHAKNLKH